MIVLLTVSVFLEIVGLILMLISFGNRSEKFPPNLFWSFKYVRPWWQHRDWFTPKGFKQIGYGSTMIVLGGIIGLIYWTPLCLNSLFH
jgi:hypothetical protein